MRLLGFITVLAIISGCSAHPVSGSHSELESARKNTAARFSYANDPVGLDVWVRPPVSGNFKGDCEEFALAAQEYLGYGDIWAVQKKSGQGHVILCHGIRCIDNEKLIPFDLDPRKYLLMIKMTSEMVDKKIQASK